MLFPPPCLNAALPLNPRRECLPDIPARVVPLRPGEAETKDTNTRVKAALRTAIIVIRGPTCGLSTSPSHRGGVFAVILTVISAASLAGIPQESRQYSRRLGAFEARVCSARGYGENEWRLRGGDEGGGGTPGKKRRIQGGSEKREEYELRMSREDDRKPDDDDAPRGPGAFERCDEVTMARRRVVRARRAKRTQPGPMPIPRGFDPNAGINPPPPKAPNPFSAIQLTPRVIVTDSEFVTTSPTFRPLSAPTSALSAPTSALSAPTSAPTRKNHATAVKGRRSKGKGGNVAQTSAATHAGLRGMEAVEEDCNAPSRPTSPLTPTNPPTPLGFNPYSNLPLSNPKANQTTQALYNVTTASSSSLGKFFSFSGRFSIGNSTSPTNQRRRRRRALALVAATAAVAASQNRPSATSGSLIAALYRAGSQAIETFSDWWAFRFGGR
ncbi:hypothetical protein AAMO2058_001481400 [Amorphochlora amoebiformis]